MRLLQADFAEKPEGQKSAILWSRRLPESKKKKMAAGEDGYGPRLSGQSEGKPTILATKKS